MHRPRCSVSAELYGHLVPTNVRNHATCDDTSVDLAQFGPFFALQDGADPSSAEGWRPLRDLYDGPALDDRVAHVATVLEQMTGLTIEPRIAASTMSLGLFARLLSPILGAAILHERLPALSRESTFWQPALSGPWPLSLQGEPVEPHPERSVTEILLPLADVIAERFALSRHVLHGNIASSVFGAIRMATNARPDLRQAAHQQGQRLLDGPLQGTGSLESKGFVRSSCCLYYRIPGGGYCGDCVLTPR